MERPALKQLLADIEQGLNEEYRCRRPDRHRCEFSSNLATGWLASRRLIGEASPHRQPQNLIRIPGGRIATAYFTLQRPPDLKFATDRSPSDTAPSLCSCEILSIAVASCTKAHQAFVQESAIVQSPRSAGPMVKAQNRSGGRKPGMAWRREFMNRSYDHHFRLSLLEPDWESRGERC
jgi:hypothetical protein